MEERDVKTIAVMTIVSKTIIDSMFLEGNDRAAQALMAMAVRTAREHLFTAFEGRPYQVEGLTLRIGPAHLSSVLPDPQDGRTCGLHLEVCATRSESGSDGAGGDA